MKFAIIVDINLYLSDIANLMFVKIAQAAIRQAKLATFSVETLTKSNAAQTLRLHDTAGLYSTLRMVRVAERLLRSIGRRVGRLL